MTNDRNKFKVDEQDNSSALTSSDLKYILDVNKKAIEIYIEVDKQNEKILETFENFKETYDNIQEDLDIVKKAEVNIERFLEIDNSEAHSEMNKLLSTSNVAISDIKVNEAKLLEITQKIESRIEEIEKNLFRLILILGSTGIGAIVTITANFLKK